MAFWNIFSSKEKKETLDKGLEKTKEGILGRLKRAVAGRSSLDADFIEELEEILITSDIGTETTFKIIDRIQERVSRDKYMNSNELYKMLYEEMARLMQDSRSNPLLVEGFDVPADRKPYVILVVGVNGAGKTTTIGKLAYQYKAAGNKVVLGAGDTFRAAAIEQLEEWSRRADVPMVRKPAGTKPDAVAYDTVKTAIDTGADVAIIDTAGRLHNKVDLMKELTAIRNAVGKLIEGGPAEVLLVLDGSTGQNAFEQAKQFSAATQVNALAVTKLDGTAKGGVIIGISDQLQVPVKYIGLGEKITDLQPFDKMAFVESLFTDTKD